MFIDVSLCACVLKVRECHVLAAPVHARFYAFDNMRRLDLDKHDCNVVSHCAASREVVMTQ